MIVRLLLLAATLLIALPAAAAEDDLARLNAQILNDPHNTDLNLRYAEAALASGSPDRAVPAYERILVYDPNNAEAKRGLARARLKVLPNTTKIVTEFGTAWESNPHNVPVGRRGDALLFGRVSIKDDRTLGEFRWRTLGSLLGSVYRQEGDLNYAYAGLATGPLFDLPAGIVFNPALGGGAAYFAHHLFYSEAFASFTFETAVAGAYQVIRIRGGYRDYDDFFPVTHGFYADAVGKFSRHNVISSDDLLVYSPWLRWSGIDGAFLVNTPVPNVANDIQIGRYVEWGSRLEYYKPLVDGLVVGANIAWSERDFAKAVDLAGAVLKRRDRIYSPGAAIIFRNVYPRSGNIRLDYRYERNDSNDPFSDYTNHVATITFSNRY